MPAIKQSVRNVSRSTTPICKPQHDYYEYGAHAVLLRHFYIIRELYKKKDYTIPLTITMSENSSHTELEGSRNRSGPGSYLSVNLKTENHIL